MSGTVEPELRPPAGEHPDRALLRGLADQLNDEAQDALLLTARWATGADDATAVRITRIDPHGVEVDVHVAAGAVRRERMPFDPPADDLHDVEERLVAMLLAARAADPEGPPTEIERRFAQARRQRLFPCVVRSVRELSPRLRALTMGPVPGFRSLGWDQSVTLMVPTVDRPVPPDLTFDELQAMPADRRPHGATYTVRRHDPTGETVELWVVLHGDDGTISSWAAEAGEGTTAALWGPRGHFSLPAGTRRALLVADETAVAAVAAILDQLPDRVAAHVVAEVDDEAHEVPLPLRDGDVVRWVHRGGDAPGTGGHLETAVRGLDLTASGLFAFGAAETGQIMPVRRYLRTEVGLDSAQVDVGGYWRRS